MEDSGRKRPDGGRDILYWNSTMALAWAAAASKRRTRTKRHTCRHAGKNAIRVCARMLSGTAAPPPLGAIIPNLCGAAVVISLVVTFLRRGGKRHGGAGHSIHMTWRRDAQTPHLCNIPTGR